MADWFESYAQILELNVWTSAYTQGIAYDGQFKTWTVDVARSGGNWRQLTCRFVVFAHGAGGGVPRVPEIKGRTLFEGKVYHSSEFKSAKNFKGKKAVVVGAGSSGHDIAEDFHRHGVDVTMFQRSATYVVSTKSALSMLSDLYAENGPPTEIADILATSTASPVGNLISSRITELMASTVDKDIYEKLERAGFETTLGPDGAGLLTLVNTRRGGFYIDVGASELIASGEIKLKHGGEIERFTPKGLLFDDKTELEADVVVFATGYGDARELAYELCESAVTERIKPMWGVDADGELFGVWRDSGHPGLYFAMGGFLLGRQYSTYLALQIKAEVDGILGQRYSIEKQAHGATTLASAQQGESNAALRWKMLKASKLFSAPFRGLMRRGTRTRVRSAV